MPDLTLWLLDNLVLVLGVIAAALIGLAAWVAILSRRLARATAAYRSLADQARGGSLGDLLVSHGARVDEVEHRLGEVDGRYRLLDERSRGSLQHVGLVRFNPFADTGSDQSFAIALLDDDRNGIVVSSLHGRAGTRIFAKPIQDGRGTHVLSDEEQEAVAMAVAGRSAAAVEPAATVSERDR